MKGHDIFISYKSDDEFYARSLVNSLEQAGLSCWISSRDIPDGKAFNREIKNAITESSALVLILSKKSDESEEVERELALATQEHKPLIPINIDNCKPDNLLYWLSRIQWISFSEVGNFNEIASRIACILGKTAKIQESFQDQFAVNICRVIPFYYGRKAINLAENIKNAKDNTTQYNKLALHIFQDGFAVIVVRQCQNYANAVEVLTDRRKNHLELLAKRELLPDLFDTENTLPVNNPLFIHEVPHIEYIMSTHHIFDTSALKDCEIFSICEPSFVGITDDPTQQPVPDNEAAFSMASLTTNKALSVINTVASKHNTFYVSWSNILLMDACNPSPDFGLLEHLQIDLQKLWFQLYTYDNFLDNCILSPDDFDIPAVKQEIIRLKLAYSKFIRINPTGAGHFNRLKEKLIETSKLVDLYDGIDEKIKYFNN